MRVLADISKDENLIDAYKHNKDIYATVASSVYHTDYWDCMEHHEDGSANPGGKKRRSNCKSIVLGLMYSRGAAAIAEQIHSTKEEAQKIMDDFFDAFPRIKEVIEESHVMARNFGYVEDKWGRRRRLPDINLPKFEVTDMNKSGDIFNPFLTCENKFVESTTAKKYREMLYNARSWKDKEEILANAKLHKLEIKDNSGIIAQAERQCLNARIQGSSASMTKIAMNKIYHDDELNNLDFRLLINVHDEVIGECPKENAEKVADRLTYIMKTCVSDYMSVPFKCDATIENSWYESDYTDILKEEYKDLLHMGIGEEAKYQIYREHTELTHEQLDEILNKVV